MKFQGKLNVLRMLMSWRILIVVMAAIPINFSCYRGTAPVIEHCTMAPGVMVCNDDPERQAEHDQFIEYSEPNKFSGYFCTNRDDWTQLKKYLSEASRAPETRIEW